MNACDRFLRYIQFDTASCETNECCPSTEGQRVFGKQLVEELLALGISDARIDEHGYVYASIPATRDNMPAIGFIAHMDTVDEVPCVPMHARVIEHYDGNDIPLENGVVTSVATFPFLKEYAGKTLIVTDGNTILGADDKAGVAAIMTMAERLVNDPSLPHGRIAIGFTPDEEIGRGADLFDVKAFGADFAYTVDGGEIGGISYENFNAASAVIAFHGISIHPGSAKDKMKNACLYATEFASLLPATQIPACTQDREGFFHLTHMEGDIENATLHYIIRDHDRTRFEQKKELIQKTCAFMNAKYGENTVSCTVTDSYYNMLEEVLKVPEIVARAEKANRMLGIEPHSEPIRGGTDGARLTFMGLPCPNLATGGMNGHGRNECLCVEDMEKMVDVLQNIATME